MHFLSARLFLKKFCTSGIRREFKVLISLPLKHPQILNSVNLKQVEVKENETAVDNLFIFTIMEINEAIDDAQTESQLRGIAFY